MITLAIIYLVLGFVYAGIPTYFDLKEGFKYDLSDWVLALVGGLCWPALLIICYYVVIIKQRNL